MTVSPAGVGFIGGFEGYRGRAYADVGGVPTIGYGHVLHGPPLTARDRLLWWPRPYALRRLRMDAARADAAVTAYTAYCRPALTQSAHDALCSFAYNCGTGALAHSTLLMDVKRNASDGTITADFLRWDHVGGKEVPGLKRRRAAEAHLFLTGRYS